MTGIESLSASLVREYLSRKGLKRSLRVLDDEFPREENSIRNRVVLAKELKIERLLRLNKELENPLRTMIEVMANFFISEKHVKASSKQGTKGQKSEERIKKSTESSIAVDGKLDVVIKNSNEGDTRSRKATNTDQNAVSQSKGTTLGIDIIPTGSLGTSQDVDELVLSRSKGSLKPISDLTSMNKKSISGSVQRTSDKPRKQKSKKSIDLNLSDDLIAANDRDLGYRRKSESKQFMLDNIKSDGRNKFPVEVQPAGLELTRQKDSKTTKPDKAAGDVLLFDEIDSDVSEDVNDFKLGQPQNNLLSKLHDSSAAISLEIATSLKSLVFGSASKSFNSEWKNQSFSFCDLPDLEYGIVQIKGGPCGVLAAVQATVLKFLMFNKGNRREITRPPNPSSKERTNALVESVAEILWRAGARKKASVVMPSFKEKFIGGGRFRSDGITETLTIYDFNMFDNLKAFISQNINQFEGESSSGCILFLYSLVFSRTIECIKSEMDEPNGTLIGAHGYCTQELVNLCLTGKAVSNVFDGIMELDSGGIHKSMLKGIEKQSDIGLLSLFEHYESCKVGENLKSPKYPIWVVCSESHFSTLFSVNQKLLQDRKLQRQFDLYYYDGLARQDEEIRLTIDTKGTSSLDSDDLIPPLEHCIRTKWKNSIVNWNNTEPIL